MTQDENNIDKVLNEYLPSASKQETEVDCNRVLQHLRSRPRQQKRSWSLWQRLALIPAAAAILAAVFTSLLWHQKAFAVVDRVDGHLYRVVDGAPTAIQAGDTLDAGDTVRTNGGSGTMLVLADGSRVEMRSKSELMLERTDGGVRVRLNAGDVIVTAAKQTEGQHLRVQTKDVTVSVVGTVFLVKAEEEGSRVAVIEGEVHVRQGAIEKSLHPGQQLLTQPVMEWQPVSEEIAWSSSKETHLALLQQSTAQNSAAAEPKETFDVVSIRPTTVQAGTGGRGQGGGGNARNSRMPDQPCSYASEPRIDPRRFDAVNATVVRLVAWAYNLQCLAFSPNREPDFLFGGPSWARNDGYDVLAHRPDGPSDYTAVALDPSHSGYVPGPKLQRMLQTMLADRFKLELHREMRETSVYVLSPLPGGPKFTAVLSPPIMTDMNGNRIDQPPVVNGIPQLANIMPNPDNPRPEFSIWQAGDTRDRNTKAGTEIHLRKKSMADFVQALSFIVGRPVIDRTNLMGVYNFFFMFEVIECATCPFTAPPPGARREGPGPTDNLFDLLKKVGLELKSSRENVEVLVIDKVDRPTGN